MILTYQILPTDPASLIQMVRVREDHRAETVTAPLSGWVVSDIRAVLPDDVGAWRLTLGANLDGDLISGAAIILADSTTATPSPLNLTAASTVEWARIIPNPGLPVAHDSCDWSATHSIRLDVETPTATTWTGSIIQFTIRPLYLDE